MTIIIITDNPFGNALAPFGCAQRSKDEGRAHAKRPKLAYSVVSPTLSPFFLLRFS